MNNNTISIAATLVIVANAGLFEKLPNTYPMMNTIEVINNMRIKMISGNIVVSFIDISFYFN